MKKLVNFILLSSALFVVNANAESEEEVIYTTEAYCLLSQAGEQENYLAAYAKKLGMKPSRSVCNSFKNIAEESTPKEWDFPGGRPYPGSAIRLSKKQVELIKASRQQQAQQ